MHLILTYSFFTWGNSENFSQDQVIRKDEKQNFEPRMDPPKVDIRKVLVIY